MCTFIAGATITGQVTARSVVERISSAIPFATLPRVFAVAGAITTSSGISREADVLREPRSPPGPRGRCGPGCRERAEKVRARTSSVAAFVMTTWTSCPACTSRLVRSAAL